MCCLSQSHEVDLTSDSYSLVNYFFLDLIVQSQLSVMTNDYSSYCIVAKYMNIFMVWYSYITYVKHISLYCKLH